MICFLDGSGDLSILLQKGQLRKNCNHGIQLYRHVVRCLNLHCYMLSLAMLSKGSNYFDLQQEETF